MAVQGLLITGSAVRVRPREPNQAVTALDKERCPPTAGLSPYRARAALWEGLASACRKSARLAVGGLLLAAGVAQASDPIADRTCIWSDTTMACYDVFVADLVLDSSARPLTGEAGPGYLRLGYMDSTTGQWVELAATHYAWRTWTSYPAPRTLLVGVDEDGLGAGGFEGEYALPLR